MMYISIDGLKEFIYSKLNGGIENEVDIYESSNGTSIYVIINGVFQGYQDILELTGLDLKQVRIRNKNNIQRWKDLTLQ